MDFFLDFGVAMLQIIDLLPLLVDMMSQLIQRMLPVPFAVIVIILALAMVLVVLELVLELLIGLTNRVCNSFSLVLQLLQLFH